MKRSQDKPKSRPREELSQYDTPVETMILVCDLVKRTIPNWNDCLWIDNSANDNRFLRTMGCSSFLAFDIQPHHPDVTQSDWLTVNTVPNPLDKPIAVCFNPPYGYHSTTAKKFVSHSIDVTKPKYLVLLTTWASIENWLHLYEILHQEKYTGHFTMRSDQSKKFVNSFIFIAKKRDAPLPVPTTKMPFFVQSIQISSTNFASTVTNFDLVIFSKGMGSVGRIIWKRAGDGWKHYRDSELVCDDCENWHGMSVTTDNSNACWMIKIRESDVKRDIMDVIVDYFYEFLPASVFRKKPAYINKKDLLTTINDLWDYVMND